jgi:predicted transcriptional regulator
MALQLTPALEQQLQELASQSDLTADELAQRALESFVAYRRELNEAVRLGDEDIAAGRVLEHEEVVARIERLLAAR